ncbi:glycosyltransferase family 2 protein [Chelativorans sp. AA-79]|uniref:glycosyltransferase n=1 Tax=Chelativorans sp. AA-79 TaxID=3028735 RepID=UPI0023F794A2|nr:glycosyltransferase family 2 protein [Chelativorans sp. AA-79]WEX08165.1 glycosyltransferase family 2 protein [Chelativorans sp. AA-79]
MSGETVAKDGIDICVCTFRRPALAETLRSLAALKQPDGYRVGIIVADNDEEPSARELVTRLVQELDLPLRYVHCPARNISIARNACLDASRARFIAFIDDDETATPDWLVRLVKAAEGSRADVVLGPVRAGYGENAPEWMRRGDFHSTFPVWVGGEIRTGYTCNVLMRMDAKAIRGRRFSLDRGQSGGEDTAFFDEVHQAGGRLVYAPDAWTEEVVPSDRATFAWLLRRRYRVGQTHGRLIAGRKTGVAYLVELVLVCAKIAYCFAMAGLTAPWPTSRNRNILRGVMHGGVLSGLMGASEIRQYGAPAEEGRGHAT